MKENSKRIQIPYRCNIVERRLHISVEKGKDEVLRIEIKFVLHHQRIQSEMCL